MRAVRNHQDSIPLKASTASKIFSRVVAIFHCVVAFDFSWSSVCCEVMMLNRRYTAARSAEKLAAFRDWLHRQPARAVCFIRASKSIEHFKTLFKKHWTLQNTLQKALH